MNGLILKTNKMLKDDNGTNSHHMWSQTTTPQIQF